MTPTLVLPRLRGYLNPGNLGFFCLKVFCVLRLGLIGTLHFGSCPEQVELLDLFRASHRLDYSRNFRFGDRG